MSPRIPLLGTDGRLSGKHIPAELANLTVSRTRPTSPAVGQVFIDATLADQNPPSGLANVIATPRSGGLRLAFTPSADNDLHHYEYRLGPDNPIATTPVSIGQANDTLISGLTDGVGVWIQVRAVDSSINAGPWSSALYRVPNPTVIEDGLLAYFDASALPAGKLAAWNDRSGNFNLGATNTNLQPTVVAGAQNGKSVIRFSGSVLLDRTIVPQPFGNVVTQIIVARYTGTLPAANGALMSTFSADTVDSNTRRVMGIANGAWYYNAGATLASTVQVDNGFHVIGMLGSEAIRVDSTTTTGYAGLRGMTTLQIGTDRDRSSYTPIEVAAVLLYSRRLDPTEFDETMIALGRAWGIA